MNKQFYSLERLPDFTMAKYSIQENSSVEDVLKQHRAFYRQMHRRGLLFGEYYTLLYWYDPGRKAGEKIRLLFRAESANQIPMMDAFFGSAALSASFPLVRCQEDHPEKLTFSFRAGLVKRSGRIESSLMNRNTSFYVIDPWKCNEDGRLIGLFRLMKALDKPCVYAVRLYPTEQTEHFRTGLQNQMRWMKPESGMSLGLGSQRDENAEKCIKLYGDFIDSLRSNPHFYCEIAAYAQDSATARLLVDAAAAEAVEEGNYSVQCGEGCFQPLVAEYTFLPADKNAPTNAERWQVLFLLKEIVPFAVFPTLYPGESIELPKETAPLYEKQGLHLGKDQQGYDVYVPLDLLPKHALLAGVPGSGKTYTMLYLASQISSNAQKIPILVLEPAKQEYRALAWNKDVWDLTVFAPGGDGHFPLRINPFEFPEGMKLSEHIVNLRQVFIGAFDLEPPMPFLLDQGLENVYRSKGWFPFEYNLFEENGRNRKPYPTMQMLFDEVAKLLDASDYAPEIRSNLKSVLQVRIGSLVSRETGNVFNVHRSTFRPEEWLEHSCVLELESLGKDAANFLTLLLSTIIRELIKQRPKALRSPRHVMFFEEAHNLIGPSTEANQATGNAKVASTKFIVDMLAEVRALKEAIVIADQLPTALASQVTKNTSTKIALRITAQDDREMLASTMSADGVQLEEMALFNPGHALCLYEGVKKPFEVQIHPYGANADSPDNDALYRLMADRPTYRSCMERDYQIMLERLEVKRKHLMDELSPVCKTGDELRMELKALFRVSDAQERKERNTRLEIRRLSHYSTKVKLIHSFLELILESGEYARLNRLKRKQIKAYMKEIQKDFLNILSVLEDDDKFRLGYEVDPAVNELSVMWAQLDLLPD